jgi:hypothetical protein
MVRWGVHALEEVSHGFIHDWSLSSGVVNLWEDSTGLATLVGKQGAIPRNSPPDTGLKAYAHLVRFDAQGAIIHPSPERRDVTLREVAELPQRAVRRILRPIPPELTAERELGTYKLLEFDSEANWSVKYYSSRKR